MVEEMADCLFLGLDLGHPIMTAVLEHSKVGLLHSWSYYHHSYSYVYCIVNIFHEWEACTSSHLISSHSTHQQMRGKDLGGTISPS